jgi:hypothetical protein
MSLLSRLSGRSDDVPAMPYDPSSPEGLAARWVQWAAAAPGEFNPIADLTGACAAGGGQPDDVWFLAGSYGERVSRRCAVPAGRPLFLPVINMWQWGEGPPPALSSPHARLELDGAEQPLRTAETPVPFSVSGAPQNGVTGRSRARAMTVWGIWASLPGLEPGEHHLHAVGGDGEDFVVDVTYVLGVA